MPFWLASLQFLCLYLFDHWGPLSPTSWRCPVLVDAFGAQHPSALYLCAQVLPPLSYSVTPAAPIATAGALAAATHGWEVQRKHDEEHARSVLREATDLAEKMGVSGALNPTPSRPWPYRLAKLCPNRCRRSSIARHGLACHKLMMLNQACSLSASCNIHLGLGV
jgi:hypothetical protein